MQIKRGMNLQGSGPEKKKLQTFLSEQTPVSLHKPIKWYSATQIIFIQLQFLSIIINHLVTDGTWTAEELPS